MDLENEKEAKKIKDRLNRIKKHKPYFYEKILNKADDLRKEQYESLKGDFECDEETLIKNGQYLISSYKTLYSKIATANTAFPVFELMNEGDDDPFFYIKTDKKRMEDLEKENTREALKFIHRRCRELTSSLRLTIIADSIERSNAFFEKMNMPQFIKK